MNKFTVPKRTVADVAVRIDLTREQMARVRLGQRVEIEPDCQVLHYKCLNCRFDCQEIAAMEEHQRSNWGHGFWGWIRRTLP